MTVREWLDIQGVDKLKNVLRVIAVCNRCDTPVDFDDVSPGYWASCPEHDEDLDKWECKLEVTQ